MTEVKKHHTRRYRSPARGVFRSAAHLLLLKPLLWTVLRIHVHGRQNLKSLRNNQAFIVIANHSSHFDAPLIAGALPRRLSGRLAAAAAADYFFKKWYKMLPTRAFFNVFPVDRDGSKTYKGLTGQLLNEKVPILIMPEGSRSRSGTLGDFKPGTAALSIKHQVPVLPIALIGAHEAWPPGAKIWRPGRPTVHVNFGQPLMPKPDESVEQFNQRLRDTVVKLYNKFIPKKGEK